MIAQIIVHDDGTMETIGDVLCIKPDGAGWGTRDGKDFQLVEFKFPNVGFAVRLGDHLDQRLAALAVAGDIDPKLVWPFAEFWEDEPVEDGNGDQIETPNHPAIGGTTPKVQTMVINPSAFKLDFSGLSNALMNRLLDRNDAVPTLQADQFDVIAEIRGRDLRPEIVRGTLAGRDGDRIRDLTGAEQAAVKRQYEREGFNE